MACCSHSLLATCTAVTHDRGMQTLVVLATWHPWLWSLHMPPASLPCYGIGSEWWGHAVMISCATIPA